MDTTKSNRLSVYLIKESFDSPEGILKDINKVVSHDFGSNSTLYLKDSYARKPDWISKFFLVTPDTFNLMNASSQAVLLTKIETEINQSRFFAIPFGSGFHLLRPGVIEERFGLKTVLNIVDEKQLRSIDKTNMSNVPKQAREQISLNSEIADFGIDIEQDLILGVTGKTKNEMFGKTITGKDALKVSVKQTIDSIDDFLSECYRRYCREDYKETFPWIDQIAQVKDGALIKELNEKVIKKIQDSDFSKIWMAVPDIIEWDDVDGFSYSYDRAKKKYDDINIFEFLDGLFPDKQYGEITIDTFLKHQAISYSSSTSFPKNQWKALNCLYSEIANDEKTYILTNAKWYEIDNNFVQEIESEYTNLLNKNCPVVLPDYNHDNEGDYNAKTPTNNPDLFCMDKKLIHHGGAYNKIEFCDLFSIKREMIHVKLYGGSSVLSHLFNQGLVAGELYKGDRSFRDKVNDRLPASHKLIDTTNIETKEYAVIYSIISHAEQALDIPFFSKVSLKNAKRRLETIGYNVFLSKIQNVRK